MDVISSINQNSISHCDLNTRFNDRCFMDWSKTNLISIVTLEGIYILEPHLDRPQGPFRIELIRNPSTPFRHKINEQDGEPTLFEDHIASLTNKQYIEIFLDSALSTNIGRQTYELPSSRRFRLAKWSPIVQKFPKECLLAAITIDYQLLIYGRKNGVWIIRSDLSSEYDCIWAKKLANPSANSSKLDYELTRDNLHAISFCHMCWDSRDRNITDENKASLNLLATTMHGDIVVWQLLFTRSNLINIHPVHDEIQAEIKVILRTKQSNISCMSLHQGLLVASSRNGQVALYDLNNYLENIDAGINMNPQTLPSRRQMGSRHGKQTASSVDQMNKSDPIIIEQPPTAVLWNHDNIEVMDFYLQSIDKEKSRMVLTKSTNICWCMIQYIKRTETSSATLIVEDSFSAIDGLTPEVSLHQTPATWLRPANNKQAVLIAEDGSFFLLNFLEDNQDISPSFSTIVTGKIDLTDMIPRGVCVSPNGHMISMISSVTYLFDPAKLPAPTKLITLPTQNDREFLLSCLQNLLDEAWLKAKAIESPMDVCDWIDYLRSLFPLWNHKQCDKLNELLKNSLVELKEPKSETQVLKLKIIGFILLKLNEYMRGMQSSDRFNGQDLDLVGPVYPVLMYREIEEVAGILDASGEISSNLSEAQVNSLKNYISWMDMNYLESDSALFYQLRCNQRDKLKKRFDRLNLQASPMQETCAICMAVIEFKSANQAECKSGHRFVRCSRSLLVIDLSKEDWLNCDHCNRHYLLDRVWPSSNIWPCLFCQ